MTSSLPVLYPTRKTDKHCRADFMHFKVNYSCPFLRWEHFRRTVKEGRKRTAFWLVRSNTYHTTIPATRVKCSERKRWVQMHAFALYRKARGGGVGLIWKSTWPAYLIRWLPSTPPGDPSSHIHYSNNNKNNNNELHTKRFHFWRMFYRYIYMAGRIKKKRE